MNPDEEPSVSDKVDILSTEDERLKLIGEILSSGSSRKILQLLFNQSFTANQISQKTELSLPLVIHHLKKMQSAGIVKITNVGKNTKSHDMKFYTIDKVALVILPSEMSKTAKKSKSLFNSFTRIHRLATLGGVSIAAWFSSQFLQGASKSPPQVAMVNSDFIEESKEMALESLPSDDEPVMSAAPETMRASELQDTSSISPDMVTGEPSVDIFWSIIMVLGIIIAGLVIEISIKHREVKH